MSAIPRLFVSSELAADAPCAVTEDQARYLLRVLRLGQGDAVRVFNGRDGEWMCVIDTVTGKTNAVLKAVEQTRVQTATRDVHLAFAPLKKTQTDLVIEKATELGVTALQAVTTDYTQGQRLRLDRMEKIALEAAEQTERLDVPQVLEPLGLATWLDARELDRVVYMLDEDGGGEGGERSEPFLTALQARTAGKASVLVGPEGGFSQSERDRLRGADNVVPVTLGPRILRAETAAILALGLWQAMHGDGAKPPRAD